MLTVLRKAPLGRIVLANIRYAVVAGHIPEKVVAEFLRDCMQRFTTDPTLGATAPVEHVVTMMTTVADANPRYRFQRNRGRLSAGRISTVVCWDVCVNHLMNPVVLNRYFIPPFEKDVEEWHFQTLEEHSGESGFFQGGAHVGDPKRGFFWATPKDEVDSVRNSVSGASLPDRLRDILGLVHHQPNMCLVELHVLGTVMLGVTHAAPTFVEAGDHARFKAQRAPGHTPDEWGRTADLAQVWPVATGACDGMPEAVVERVPFRPGMDWHWRGVGKVQTYSEGRTGSDPAEGTLRHVHFSELLMRKSNWNAVVHYLQYLMKNF